MRHVLRNQDKLRKHFYPSGDEVVNRMIRSLKIYFAKGGDVEEDQRPGSPYPIIGVDDCGHTCGIIVFYVISKKYDVYTFAFKEFIS